MSGVERGRSARIGVIAVIALVILLATEAVVRVRGDVLPPPLKWAADNLDRKAQQIDALAANGGASVVFLGSSAVNSAFNPDEFQLGDRPAYNAAVRGGTTTIVSAWARDLALPRLRPDVVVVGVASREMNEAGEFLRGVETKYFDSPAVRLLHGNETALQKAERYAESASAIFKYRTWLRKERYLSAFLGLRTAPTVSTTRDGDPVAPNGQLSAGFRPPRPYQKFFLTDAEPRLPVSAKKRADFRSLVTYLGRHVEHVVIVNMPVTKDYVAGQAKDQREYFESILTSEAERIDATYVDGGIWPTKYFRDPVHTNAQGSARLTKIVLDEVEAL